MKKILTLALTLILAVSAMAQETCTTTWPYLYPSFRSGTVYFKDGTKTVRELVNIHCLRGRLHYVDPEGKIKEAFSKDILFMVVGGDKFMIVNSDVMRVEAETENAFVAAHYACDFTELNETGGAYGTSSTTSATTKQTSIDVAGGANMNHMEMWESRNNGQTVPLKCTYYLVYDGTVYPVSKKDFEKTITPEQKTALKGWLKANKINWKDPQSLIKLADFLKQ